VSQKRPILLLLIPAIAVCDSQVDGNHHGTAFTRLEGMLSATDLETPLQVDLVGDPGQLDVPNWT